MANQSDEKILLTHAPTVSKSRRPYFAALVMLLALLALAIVGWQWFESRHRIGVLEQEVAKRLSEVDALNRDTRALAAHSRENLGDINARLGQLEARIYETQNQRLALESLYRDLIGSREEWTLAEVEQELLIANQQIQLAGNVKSAMTALETADARLARMDRPQLTALRRVIKQDMERLKAVPYVDVIGTALRLDNILNQVDAFALAMEQRPARPDTEPAAPAAGYWLRIWQETKHDLRALIRIQNVENPEVALLSPEQAFFLRENLKLRLLGARLALLAHDEASFKTDLKAASGWLARYFDGTDSTVASAQSALKQLVQANIAVQMPDISASLDAARNFKLLRERTLR
jgi:uroporphyrin-3 C-methyltransferase